MDLRLIVTSKFLNSLYNVILNETDAFSWLGHRIGQMRVVQIVVKSWFTFQL